MVDVEELKVEFDREMRMILEREGEFGLCSARFRQMIEEGGGYVTAKRLLSKGEPPPNTFTYLRKIQRLDLAMEFYVAMDKYRQLFSDDERLIAKWRLVQGD